VSKTLSESNQVARRYASALLDLAEDAKSVGKVEKDMADLSAMLNASEDLRKLVTNPLMSRENHIKGITAIAEKAKFNKLTINFLSTLASNRRLTVLPQMIVAVEKMLRARRGEIEAYVQSAVALSAAQTKALKKQLSDSVGSDVNLNVEVNKEILGGLIITVGSQMIDDSVRRKLERLQRSMSSGSAGANENSNENQVKLEEVG
jgi:F-type H+-transporting ATPase subunit delta